jgi:uncharacterized membrane protein
MLVVFPIGLWVFSLLCDLFYLGGGSREVWSGVALYTMLGGFLGALIAAIPGIIDFLAMRGGRIRRIAKIHMTMNLALVCLYAVNIWLRISNPAELGLPIFLSVVCVGVLAVSAWLGGELVHVHAVGVETPPAPERAAQDRARHA